MKIVLSNASPVEADSIARTVVEERLAACVNMLPVKSVYEWQGKIEVDEEVTLLMKVPAEGVEALKKRLRELHSYELPEIVALEVDLAGSLDEYVEWVRSVCR